MENKLIDSTIFVAKIEIKLIASNIFHTQAFDFLYLHCFVLSKIGLFLELTNIRVGERRPNLARTFNNVPQEED